MTTLSAITPDRMPPVARRPAIDGVAQALPHPLLLIEGDETVLDVNVAAESFFDSGRAHLMREPLSRLCGPTSPVMALVAQARDQGSMVRANRVILDAPRLGGERLVDIHAAPLPEAPGVTMLMLQAQTLAEKFSRQMFQRGASRSVATLAAVLAHEIKNPLSGIRGAAQLLDTAVTDGDRQWTQLIRDETDRIVKLVDRFETFTDARPIPMGAVNVHSVLDHVRRLAISGFARHIRITEQYDPSLPPARGNHDQLVQVVLNLVKNAAEAIGEGATGGEITLSTAYRAGVRVSVPGVRENVRLPLEIAVADNGPGIPEDLKPHLFDPFVTSKRTGSGLGLATAAKIVGDHGGIVECESHPRRTVFRIMLPVHRQQP